MAVYLIEPTFNDAPAAFQDGWNVARIDVEAGALQRIDVVVCSERADETPLGVALRYAAQGRISSPMTVRCDGRAPTVTQATLDRGAEEPAILSDRPGLSGPLLPAPQTLRDRLSPSEMARLDYGQAVICLRRDTDRGPGLLPFCTLPVHVDGDGSVRAEYSGMAVTLAEAPDFPLSAVERGTDGSKVFSVSRVALFGDAAFYADLSFELRLAANGDVAPDEYTVSSDELGGAYHQVPCALFSELRSGHAIVQLTEEEGVLCPRPIDDCFLSVALKAPLSVLLRPAAELAEVYAYFEYFFTDNQSAVHAPFPLTGKQ